MESRIRGRKSEIKGFLERSHADDIHAITSDSEDAEPGSLGVTVFRLASYGALGELLSCAEGRNSTSSTSPREMKAALSGSLST